MINIKSANFGFLNVHDARLVQLGALAERYFPDDPNTAIIKLRQFGEALAQQVAARMGLFESGEESQADLLRRLKIAGATPRDVSDLFHHLRIAGNDAVHAHAGDHRQALVNLKIARQLAIWFHRAFGGEKGFHPGPFVPPSSPADASRALQEEIAALRAEQERLLTATERAQAAAEEAQRLRETAEERARREAEERAVWAELAEEAERDKSKAIAQLKALQSITAKAPSAEKTGLLERAEAAAQRIDLDEAATRVIIDQKLRDRGWDVDSKTLSFAKGARPIKGKAMAIAEWPTDSGPVDYAFFIGTDCIAVAEAKRANKNISAAIDQAERYARGIRLDPENLPEDGPWGGHTVCRLSSRPTAGPISSSLKPKVASGSGMCAGTAISAVRCPTGLRLMASGPSLRWIVRQPMQT